VSASGYLWVSCTQAWFRPFLDDLRNQLTKVSWLTNVCHRHIVSTTGSNHGVSETGEQTRRRLRGAQQPRAIACGRVWPPDTTSSDTCKCCIMLACTHLLGSCHQQRQDKERRRVRAHCTNCEICAGNRCLVCTLAYIGILLLSSSLYLSPSLSASPARRGESWRWSQMCALTSIIASNALAAGG